MTRAFDFLIEDHERKGGGGGARWPRATTSGGMFLHHGFRLLQERRKGGERNLSHLFKYSRKKKKKERGPLSLLGQDSSALFLSVPVRSTGGKGKKVEESI